MSQFNSGDIVWVYATEPQRSNPHMQPERCALIDSIEWDGRRIWRCQLLDSPFKSQWHYDEQQFAREPVRPTRQVVE